MKKLKNIPLTCPCLQKYPLTKIKHGYLCSKKYCEHSQKKNAFPFINSIPIIISETKTDTVYSSNSNTSYIKRPFIYYIKAKKIIFGESKVTKSNCRIFINEILKSTKKSKILVIGGAEKGLGTEELWENKNIEIHSVDIYATNNVDVVCDGHYLPLKGKYYDGVWIQAVLEHVVEPSVVVNEIFRVLKIGGIVYAETPFMQQVHEGAYDFNRFTVLGHRYLFKKFECIGIGGVKGPELVFAWATKYFIWSITRSKKIARVTGILLVILMRPFEILMSKQSYYDASSAVYFLGKKIIGKKLKHKDLLKLYKGSM